MIDRPLSEKEWRARDDAHTLARAEEIKQDRPRLNEAQNAAKTMLEDQRKETQALAKVAKQPQNKGPQTPVKQKQGRRSSTHNVFRRI